MRKDSAFQVAAELPLHIGWQRPAVIVTVAALDEPGREVLLDAALEHAPARTARLVLPKCVFPGLARGAGGHWQLGLGHAAEVRWLSTRRRRGIARRRSARKCPLTGKFHGDTDRQLLAAFSSSFVQQSEGATYSPEWGRAQVSRSRMAVSPRKPWSLRLVNHVLANDLSSRFNRVLTWVFLASSS